MLRKDSAPFSRRSSALLLLAVACTGEMEPLDCETLTPSAEVGTGTEGFEPITPGQQVTMVHGPQGGWHIWFAFLAFNFDDIVIDTISIDQVSPVERRLYEYDYSVALVPGPEECSLQAYAIYGFLPFDDPETPDIDESAPADIAGAQLRMSVALEGLNEGGFVEDSVDVIAACDPVDVPNYPACSGG